MSLVPPKKPARGTMRPVDQRKVTIADLPADVLETEEEPKQEEMEPPPQKTYSCGCPFPGQHKPDCMWSLWEQMRDNYLQTKHLMTKFMTQAVTLQTGGERPECECQRRDQGEATGLQQMFGVTVPWGHVNTGVYQPPEYHVESESQRVMEEQRRIKNTWVQFLNIFNMSLDLANDVSRDRWEANKQRKERARLERQEQLEEQRRQHQARGLLTSTTTTGKKPETFKKKSEEKSDEEKSKSGVKSPKMSKAKSPKMSEVKSPKVSDVKSPKVSEVKSPKVSEVKSPKVSETKSAIPENEPEQTSEPVKEDLPPLDYIPQPTPYY